MRRELIVSLVVTVGLLAGGAGIMTALIRTRPTPPEANSGRPALIAHAVKLEPRTMVEPIVGYGTALADRQAWVSAQVAGEIVKVAADFKAGAPVAEQQELVWIDNREYQARLKRAESQLAADEAALRQLDVELRNVDGLISIAEEEFQVADREFNRVRILFEQGSSSPREVDGARLDFERARRSLQTLVNQKALLPQRRAQLEAMRTLHGADVTLAQLNVEHCTVTAPFAGRLNEVLVEYGERVAPGARLFSIVDPLHIEVPIELPVARRGRLRVGAPCQLTLESRADAIWTGRVARIAPSANALTRTFALFVEVDNRTQAEPLIPGMFVRARIDGPTLADALVLPRGSIQDNRVYVYRDGQAHPRTVHIERHLLDLAVISGLAAGDVVITSNLDALYDGAAVDVLLDNRPPEAPADDHTPPTRHTGSSP